MKLADLEYLFNAKIDGACPNQGCRGRYNSASEVISQALRNLDVHKELLDELLFLKHGDALKPGLEDVRLGQFSPLTLDERIAEAEQEDVIG